MTRKQKLFERLADPASDRSWTFADAESVMIAGGFEFIRSKGSHHLYRIKDGSDSIIIPRHGSSIKATYIKQIREKLLP